MSHFTVLVPAENKEKLEKVLLPYHEYECTGIEEYTEFVIAHPANEAEAAAREIVQREYVQNDPELKGEYEAYLKEGDIASIFEDWDGYTTDAQGNIGRVTNPNAKWDWWLIGGRWTGKLFLKDGKVGTSGEPGLLTPANTDPTRADSALVGDVDWNAIKAEQLGNVMEKYDTYHSYLNEVREGPTQKDIDRASQTWNDEGRGQYCQETYTSFEDYALSVAADRIAGDNGHHWFDTFQESADLFYKSREEYQAMFDSKAMTYAFIDTEGRWNQRGEMGWFGMDNPEKGTPDYDAAFWAFIESLDPSQRVYVVDCHI